jgi:hypothetical protein
MKLTYEDIKNGLPKYGESLIDDYSSILSLFSEVSDDVKDINTTIKIVNSIIAINTKDDTETDITTELTSSVYGICDAYLSYRCGESRDYSYISCRAGVLSPPGSKTIVTCRDLISYLDGDVSFEEFLSTPSQWIMTSPS